METDTRTPRLRITAACYHHRKRKLKLLKLLGGKCIDCGYDKHPAALDFDHINPKSKIKNAGSLFRSRWDVAVAEVIKCVIRCSNCHRIKTAETV